MDKQAQDKLWNELSEESKVIVKNAFGNIDSALKGKCINAEGMKHFMNALFGSHNLNPKPPTPKTWEDMIDNEKFEEIDSTYVELEDFLINKDMDNKLRNKILATYQIQQLIELGYGGMVSEEEWSDYNVEKFCVVRNSPKIENCRLVVGYEFIAFHSPEQREEFMSHESNRQLVKQYFLM